MKTQFVLALGAFLVTAPAAAETETSRSNVRGLAASAGWHDFDGCVERSAGLWAYDHVDRSTAGQPVYQQEVIAHAIYFDHCTGRSFEAVGTAATRLEIDGLDGAVVEIPMQMTWFCDVLSDGIQDCAAPLESATLTAIFTPDGEVMTERSMSMFENGTLRVLDRYAGKHRWQAATGSLVLGGAELIGQMMDAALFDITTGRHQVPWF